MSDCVSAWTKSLITTQPLYLLVVGSRKAVKIFSWRCLLRMSFSNPNKNCWMRVSSLSVTGSEMYCFVPPGLKTLANSSSKYMNQSAQTSDTTELVSSEGLPPAMDSTDPLNLTDSSTNTSLVHTADIAVGTTGITMADIAVGTTDVEVADVSINTSFALEEDQVDLRKHLEAAQITVELLQCSRENSQQKVISLETVIDSLQDELRGKDDRLATLSARLTEMVRKYEVRCSAGFLYLAQPVAQKAIIIVFHPTIQSTESDLQYRQLYQRSVQHCEVMQSQVEKFQALFDKMNRAKQLKVTTNQWLFVSLATGVTRVFLQEAVLALLAENKAFLDTRWQQLSNQEQQWVNKVLVILW